jgi:hypothetical protein
MLVPVDVLATSSSAGRFLLLSAVKLRRTSAAAWPLVVNGRLSFFSKLCNAQAWATWRRAWRFSAAARDLWQSPKARVAVAEFLNDPDLFAWRASIYENPTRPDRETWDTQFRPAPGSGDGVGDRGMGGGDDLFYIPLIQVWVLRVVA